MQVISNQTGPANVAIDPYHAQSTLFAFMIGRTGEDYTSMLIRTTNTGLCRSMLRPFYERLLWL